MNLEITILYEKLKAKHTAQCFINVSSTHIRAAKILKKTMSEFQQDILYMGRVSDLPEHIHENGYLNLLCIKDMDVPRYIINNTLVNLILIDGPADLTDFFNEVQDIMLEFQRFVQSSAAMLNSIIGGRGIQYIIEIGYKLLGNPIMLGDSNYRLLAYSRNDEVDDPAWNELITKGYCSYDYVKKYKFKELIEREIKSQTPFIAHEGAAENTRRIMAKVEVNNKVVGHLAVLEYKKPFTESDIEITSFICSLISSEMQKNSYYLNTQSVLYENFITDLLNGKNINEETVLERINYLNLKLKEKLYLLSIDIGGYENTYTLIPYIRDSLGKIIEGENAVIYDNHIVILLGCSKDKNLKEEDFKPLVEFLKKSRMYAGLSQSFSKLAELKKYYRQSIAAIDLGLRMNRNGIMYIYGDYAIYHMVNICSKSHDITDFCHPVLLLLIEYDKKHKTDYVKSLYAYIVKVRNIISAADSLFIHRNTMSYRISKIQEIAGIDLNNDDLIMNLYVSYKILEYSERLHL